jgi:hypothetical protein
MRSWAPFRWLAMVCVIAVVVGYCERYHQDINVDPLQRYPKAMAHLYPGTAQAEYLTGREIEALASLGADPQDLQRPESLEKFLADLQPRLEATRKHYERALAAGLRSEENLQYNYALTLIRLRADSELIAQAIAAWRRDFPHSERRDLETRWMMIQDEQDALRRYLQQRQTAPARDWMRHWSDEMSIGGRRQSGLPSYPGQP